MAEGGDNQLMPFDEMNAVERAERVNRQLSINYIYVNEQITTYANDDEVEALSSGQLLYAHPYFPGRISKEVA